jgi:hypothetical protein
VIAEALGFGNAELRKASNGLASEVSRMLVAMLRKLQQ